MNNIRMMLRCDRCKKPFPSCGSILSQNKPSGFSRFLRKLGWNHRVDREEYGICTGGKCSYCGKVYPHGKKCRFKK
ncbi:MAG: hypothetical protein UU77_C0010G0007 [candidate division WWE3 bacterium GW2011_GWC1_41_7]|uniref:Uncharacterized protein n=2 Tax=Katanobacteria TaxID=422282 RepID=A0A0G1A6L9_UNCKA|nr:MAG: hypothetical protein UU72_C0029G0008 [candidate division WWE3 bacterium GW2011_GWB1_41_6]KKS20983.1 MAG: hypothetical protein UU77_C0010G0007 [candidate division WWE3 bacterium GW2011_GWC1_41_7]